MKLDKFSDHTELAGLSERERTSLTAADLRDQYTEPDVLLRIGGEVVLPGEDLTESALAERARRLLPETPDDDRRAEQFSTE